MPPFTYATPQNPYALSIGEALRQRGDIDAQRAVTIGNAQAQAAQASGQVWGNAISGIGKDVAHVLSQQADPDQQLAKLKLQAYTANQAGLAKANQIVAGLITDGPNGSRVVDRAKAQALMAQGNVPNDIQSQVFKQLDDTDASIQKFAAARQAHVADLAGHAVKMIDAGLDPALAISSATQLALANGVTTQQEVQPVLDALAKAPDAKSARAMLASLAPEEKLTVLPEGATAINGAGAVVSQGTPKPPTVESATLDAYLGSLGKPKGTAWADLTPQEQAGLPAWKAQIEADSQPITIKTMEHGKPVERVMTRAEALKQGLFPSQPPASIQVQNMAAGQVAQLPAWATDDSRPSGPDANRIDPIVRMTPNGLYQAAMTNLMTGQFPQTGRGSDPAAQAVRAAITSKVGAIAAAAGVDEPTLRALYRSNAASLTQQQKLFDAAQTNITTADRNVAELEPFLAKLPDTGSPLLNQPLRAFDKSVKGDPNMGPIATYLQSVQNEYGKIISSSNGSQVLSDSARHEAETLLDPKSTVQQMLGSIQALKTEGGNRLLSIGDQIQRIQQRMQVNPGGAGGSIIVTAPDGSQHPFVTQAQADAFKKLAHIP